MRFHIGTFTLFIVEGKKRNQTKSEKKNYGGSIQEWRDESLNAAAAHHAHCRISTVATAMSRSRTLEAQESLL